MRKRCEETFLKEARGKECLRGKGYEKAEQGRDTRRLGREGIRKEGKEVESV